MKSTNWTSGKRKMAPLMSWWAIILAFIALSSVVSAQDQMHESFDPENFDTPTNTTNAWLPLTPGLRLVYAGTTISDEGEPLPHRLTMTMTSLTKMIDGVRAVVAYDLDFNSGKLVERELAFYAQDNVGNIWRMGEHPEEFEDGEFVVAPTWFSGIKGSVAGIEMRADPKLGSRSYSQGWAPSVEFTDRGKVDKVGDQVCVPMNCYENVLVIAETSQAEPDAEQLKFFAKGIGNVLVRWRGEGEKTKEVLRLVDVTYLNDAALAEVNAKAKALEKHAYEISKEVYGKTPPLQQLPETSGM